MFKTLGIGISFTVITAVLYQTADFNLDGDQLRNTTERLAQHGYRSEQHTVQTADGYILQMTRITASPQWQRDVDGAPRRRRPSVFLAHGMFCSADTWIISAPDRTLAYLLADAGYDVWLGNMRGNRYTRRHRRLSPTSSQFWQYNLHDLGYYDLTAMVDYTLNATGEPSLHYVCDSQGCTVFFIALSSRPEYNSKIRTSHHLSPLVLQRHSQMPIRAFTQYGFPHDSLVGRFLADREYLGHGSFWNWMCLRSCDKNAVLYGVCAGVLGGAGGGWNMSRAMLSDFCATHPAGSSSNQLLHYLQICHFGRFQQFDYGPDLNRRIYHQSTPPEYDLSAITSRVFIYYSDQDYLSDPLDNELLSRHLANVELYMVPKQNFNHYDFLWNDDVKELVYDRIVEALHQYEATKGGSSV